MSHSSRSGSAAILAVLLIAVAAAAGAYVFLSSGESEPNLLPGEAEFLAQVEPAEALIAQLGAAEPTASDCRALKSYFDEGVKAFKVLMPQLEGFALRKRDDRLGKIREYTEANC